MPLYVTRSLDEANETIERVSSRKGSTAEMIVRPETPSTRGAGPLYVVRYSLRSEPKKAN